MENMPPDVKEIFEKQGKTKKLRTFRVLFSNDKENRLSKMMAAFDVWPKDGSKFVASEGTITSYTDLPLADYKKLLEWIFAQTDGQLHDMEEVIRP